MVGPGEGEIFSYHQTVAAAATRSLFSANSKSSLGNSDDAGLALTPPRVLRLLRGLEPAPIHEHIAGLEAEYVGLRGENMQNAEMRNRRRVAGQGRGVSCPRNATAEGLHLLSTTRPMVVGMPE